MRRFKRILLVALLTIFMVAAGVAWERFYVTPLVDRTEQKASRTLPRTASPRRASRS